jgi:hypothetical protein
MNEKGPTAGYYGEEERNVIQHVIREAVRAAHPEELCLNRQARTIGDY